jgi:hypothetical protein
VRLTQIDAPTIVEKFAATFETYWANPDYERYDPARDVAREAEGKGVVPQKGLIELRHFVPVA